MEQGAISNSIGKVRSIGVLLAGIGVVLAAISIASIKAQFIQMYMFGFTFWFCLTLGCFGLMLLHNLVRSYWGRPAIRIWEAGALNMPLMALLFVPILVLATHIYPWADAKLVAATDVLQFRHNFMNVTAVGIRSYIFYFGVWTAAILFLRLR